MAKNLNRFQLLGHLGQDPEIRTTPSGQKVCNFNMATSERYKDRTSGEWKEITDWHRVVAWEWVAETAEKYLKRGSKVFVEGKLKTRKDEKDGATQYITEIRAENIIFMGDSRGEGQSQSGSSSYGSKSDSSYSQPEPSYEEPQSNSDDGDDDDDVPF